MGLGQPRGQSLDPLDSDINITIIQKKRKKRNIYLDSAWVEQRGKKSKSEERGEEDEMNVEMEIGANQRKNTTVCVFP